MRKLYTLTNVNQWLLLTALLIITTAAHAQDPQLVFSKSFADSSIEIGQVTTLSFILENPAAVIVNDLAFIDMLPAGLQVAAIPNIINDCAPGVVTAVSAGNTISFAGGLLSGPPSPDASCTISVDIEGIATGQQNNVTTPLTTSTEGVDDSVPATAAVTVTLVELAWDLAGTGDWFEATNWDPDRVPNGDVTDVVPVEEVATINNGGTAQVIDSGMGTDGPAVILAADLNIGTNGGTGTLEFIPGMSPNEVPFTILGYNSFINIGFAESGSPGPSNGSLIVDNGNLPFVFASLDSPGTLNVGVNSSVMPVTGDLTLSSNFLDDPGTQVFSDIAIGFAGDDGDATGTVLVEETGFNTLPANDADFAIGVSEDAGSANGTLSGGALFGIPQFLAGFSLDDGDATAMVTSVGEIGPGGTLASDLAIIGVSLGAGNATATVNQDLDLVTDFGFGPFTAVNIGLADSTGSAVGSLVASAGLITDTLNLGIASKGSGGADGSLLIDHGLLLAGTVDLGGFATLTLNLNGPLRATDGNSINNYSAIDAESFSMDGNLVVNLQFLPDSGQDFILIDTPAAVGLSGVFDSMEVNNLPTGLTATFQQQTTAGREQLILTIGGTINPPNWDNPNIGAMAGDWFDSVNWSNVTVPTMADIVTVNNGGLAIADSTTAPGDIIANSIVVGINGGSGSVRSNAVNINTSDGILIGTADSSTRGGATTSGDLTITDAEINVGVGANSEGSIGIGVASGSGIASGELMVTNSNINVDDGIVVGFADADDIIPSSSAAGGNFTYNGAGPATNTITLNNGNLRVADVNNEALEGSQLTTFGSATIQNVTITGGELQITEFSLQNESVNLEADANTVLLNNVIVEDNEIDVSVVNVDQQDTQVRVDANTVLIDVSFTNVTGADNFQSGDSSATAINTEVFSSVSQIWTRVDINAQSDFRAGFSETTDNGVVSMGVSMPIQESNLMVDQFRIGDVDASGNSDNGNNTFISLSMDSTINANDLRIADVVSNDSSLVTLSASLNITDSVVNIDNQVRVSTFEGNSINNNSTITAGLSLAGSSLAADDMNISAIKEPAGSVDASLILATSLVALNEITSGDDGQITFGLEGLNRVTQATVGAANTYAAIDTGTGVLAGEIIADFSFVPAPGRYDFDLIIADTSLNADAATLTVNNLPPLFNIVDFSVISEDKLSILRLTIEGGNDLSISKLNSEFIVGELDIVNYTITVSNNGAEDAANVNVVDVLPATLDLAGWTCTPSGNASCTNTTGNGDIDEFVDITAGDSVEFVLTATVVGSESEIVINTATVIPPDGFLDGIAGNNSATDEDAIGLFIGGFEELQDE